MHLSVHLSPPPLPLFCSPLLFIYFSFFPNIHSLFPLLTHWMPRARCHLEKCVIFCLTFRPFLQGPISVLSKWIRTRGFFFPPRIVHLYYYIWHSRSWWVHGKSESWLLTLSTVFCSTLGLFGSILLPVSHFISNIDNPSEHSPHKDAIIKSNLIFFFFTQNTFTESSAGFDLRAKNFLWDSAEF